MLMNVCMVKKSSSWKHELFCGERGEVMCAVMVRASLRQGGVRGFEPQDVRAAGGNAWRDGSSVALARRSSWVRPAGGLVWSEPLAGCAG